MIMERDQEDLQFLGFFGILKESLKIIFSLKKIFTQITVTLILPLSFIFLFHIQVFEILFSDNNILNANNPNTYDLSSSMSLLWAAVLLFRLAAFWLFKASFFTFLAILSLLPISAVVYSIACMYAEKEITFRKVASVVPKVWKRLVVTFAWSFAIFLDYNVVGGALFVVAGAFVGFGPIGIVIIYPFLFIFYFIGFVYLSIVGSLASVVSVLEDVCGFQALLKSKALIKGKMGISAGFFILLLVCIIGIRKVFDLFVLPGRVRFREGVGTICLVFLLMVTLFWLVVQTFIYFVCKSYHHENIDQNSLADHLESYVEGNVPPKAKDVRLGGMTTFV
jgi:hypothetical protein